MENTSNFEDIKEYIEVFFSIIEVKESLDET